MKWDNTLMYKHGRPMKRHSYKVLLGIFLGILLIVFGAYSFLVKGLSNKTTINNQTSTHNQVANNNQTILTINEPLFSMQLPGHWQESSRNNDPRYQNIQWNYVAKQAAGRWLRVYIDTVPADFAINYLQPVTAVGDMLTLGQMSDNCVSFTQGATSNANRDTSVPDSQAILPARWQEVTFMCDNTHVSHQVVGTGSKEGANVVTVKGPQHGQHKYFFVYEDDNYHPDYSIFADALASFKAK